MDADEIIEPDEATYGADAGDVLELFERVIKLEEQVQDLLERVEDPELE